MRLFSSALVVIVLGLISNQSWAGGPPTFQAPVCISIFSLDSANKETTDVAVDFPVNSAALVVEARELAQKGNVASAEALVDRALRVNPNDFEALYFKIEILMINNLREARKLSDIAIHFYPQRLRAWRQNLAIHVDLKNWELALVAVDRAIALERKNSGLWHTMGTVLEKLGRIEEAQKAIAQATNLSPGEPILWIKDANLLLKLGKYEDAALSNFLAIQLRPAHAVAYGQRANILYRWATTKPRPPIDVRKNLLDEALQNITKALEINVMNHVGWRLKALILVYQEKRVEAHHAVELAMKHGGLRDPITWGLKAHIEFKLKYYESALNTLNGLLAWNPNNAGAWAEKARILFTLHRNHEADLAVRTSLQLAATGRAMSLRDNIQRYLYDRRPELDEREDQGADNHFEEDIWTNY